MNQLTFDEVRRSRATDPQTSRDAAAQSHGLAHAHCEQILRVLNDSDRSLSAHEIAARAGLTPVQVSRRLGQMRDDGVIVVDEARDVLTPSGRRAQCWRLP